MSESLADPYWYGLDEHGQPVPMTLDDPRWRTMFSNSPGDLEHDARRVAISRVDRWQVSTVFLAIDHNWGSGPPVLWETMVFGPEPWTDWQDRYTSREAAEAGHQRVVEALLRGDSPDVLPN